MVEMRIDNELFYQGKSLKTYQQKKKKKKKNENNKTCV